MGLEPGSRESNGIASEPQSQRVLQRMAGGCESRIDNPFSISSLPGVARLCVARYHVRGGVEVVSIFARVISRASDARDGLVTVCSAAHVGIAAKPRVLMGVGRAGLPDVRFTTSGTPARPCYSQEASTRRSLPRSYGIRACRSRWTSTVT
jgi:hypothetical protein